MSAAAAEIERRALGAVLHDDVFDAKRTVAVDGRFHGDIAEMARLVIEARHDKRCGACAVGDGLKHRILIRPQARADVGVEDHQLTRRPGAAQFGEERIDIMGGGENGERDAGEIDDIGAFHRPAQVVRIGGQLPCGGGVAPVAEGALAVLQVDEVKAGRAALDAADFFRADAGFRNEGQHVFR